MTPEEIESQFNALSSSIYAQDRVTSFNSQNNFRKEISRKHAKPQRLRNLFNKAFLSCQPESFIKSKIISALQGLSSGFKFGIGFALALFTAGIFAVSVSGTFNTFSPGALLKSSDINTNFATLKAAIESLPSQPSMRLIYETDVTSATTSVIVSGLDGNTDLTYMIHTRFVANSAGGCDYLIRPNNDNAAANYGYLVINSTASTLSSGQYTSFQGMSSGNTQASSQTSSCRSFLYAKTGVIRHLLSDCMEAVNGTTVGYKDQYGSVWNNTATNITSLTFFLPVHQASVQVLI